MGAERFELKGISNRELKVGSPTWNSGSPNSCSSRISNRELKVKRGLKVTSRVAAALASQIEN